MALQWGSVAGVLTANVDGALNQVILANAGFGITDDKGMTQLWTPQAIRGNNVVIPGTPGVDINPSRTTEAKISLGMTIVGECDRTGAPYADYAAGVMSNVNYLMTHLIRPGYGRAVTFVDPIGNSWVGTMQFDQLMIGEWVPGGGDVMFQSLAVLAVLKLRLPTPLVPA